MRDGVGSFYSVNAFLRCSDSLRRGVLFAVSDWRCVVFLPTERLWIAVSACGGCVVRQVALGEELRLFGRVSRYWRGLGVDSIVEELWR
jgi:hypothetical protein